MRAGFLSERNSVKIISDSPATLSWPWEILCDPKSNAFARFHSVERQPREIGGEIRPIERETDELRILFVISRPDDVMPMNYPMLARKVLDYVSREGLSAVVDVSRPPTFENLKNTLERKKGYYHIVHFDGHDLYGTDLQRPGERERALAFETNEGFEHDVTASELERFFTECPVPVITFNACQSAMMDEQSENPFSSVAPALLRAGVRSVAAMGYKLYARAARVMIPAFYVKLLKEGSVSEAVIAARQARKERRGI